MTIADLYILCKVAGVTDDGIKLTNDLAGHRITATCTAQRDLLPIAGELAATFGLKSTGRSIGCAAEYTGQCGSRSRPATIIVRFFVDE